MRNHTPTPWILESGERENVISYVYSRTPQYETICMNTLGDHKANSAFIVKACNAYDETQQLLMDLAEYFDDRKDADDGQPNEEMRFAMRIKELQDA